MKILQTLAAAEILLLIGSLQAQVGGGAQASEARPSNGATGRLKAVPFSADVVDESTRILPDGTSIQHETHGKSFRDSEGRTRTESEVVLQLPSGEQRLQHITIFDPVRQVFISLDPKAKTAIVRPWQSQPLSAGSADTAKPAAAASTPVQESLGTTEIEGFPAVGYKTTRTIESGKIGNDRPLVVVTESWFSPDLVSQLRSKTEDPQSGQSTMKLVNIKRGEPDPILFQVPQDYAVDDTRTQK